MNLAYVPNMLSCMRIALIPVILSVSSLEFKYSGYIASCLFLTASLTDFLDGYIARKLESTSRIGAILDLVADKLLITSCLIWLITLFESSLILFPILIIISRELILSSLREYFSNEVKKETLQVNKFGKIKTTLQMIAVAVLFLATELSNFFIVYAGVILLWSAAFFSLFSMYVYVKNYFSFFKNHNQ